MSILTSGAAASGRSGSPEAHSVPIDASEGDPLLGTSSSPHPTKSKKRWYRARPLWLVPFAITASLCRGMTLAPRSDVFIELACEDLWQTRHHHSRHQHTHSKPPRHTEVSATAFPVSSDIDGSVPFMLINSSAVQISSAVDLAPSPDSLIPDGHMPEDDVPIEDDTPIDCLAEPIVQAGAAKLQTMMTTIMGLLSALTTGWWGQFGDKYGRTKVISSAIFGLLFTDVMFIIASDPPEFLRGRAHQLLIVAPVVEGLLGGWSTLQGATQAYISDCTSHGSRANIFSQFTGVFYIGFALGPEIAALILRSTHATTVVFYTSSLCAFINLFLVLFVFPESLSADLRERNIEAAQEATNKALHSPEGKNGLWKSFKVSVMAFIKPMGILGPKPRQHGRGQDWSLTLIALSIFAFNLSVGLFQIKYLYAKHMYSWDAETLSYYITGVGSARAIHLLILLPAVIRALKPTPSPSPPSQPATASGRKVQPTPRTLLSEIKFDLMVAKVSTSLDGLSHLLVTLASSSSEGLFVWLSMISSFGSGMVPALYSVAMCTLHLREIADGSVPNVSKGGGEIGKLFGAFAVLQAVGSMILGPLLFGMLYSVTVAVYPKAIFVAAAGLMVISVSMLVFIRPPRVDVPIEIRVETQVEVDIPRPRGRSRKSKDIRRPDLR